MVQRGGVRDESAGEGLLEWISSGFRAAVASLIPVLWCSTGSGTALEDDWEVERSGVMLGEAWGGRLIPSPSCGRR